MPRPLPHPTRDQIELPDVLDCLSDPTRLAIVYNLARHDQSATSRSNRSRPSSTGT